MNKYEFTVVVDGKTGAAKKKKAAELLDGVLKLFKGKILNEKEWGVKDLAYRIEKSDTGLYLFYEIELEAKGVKALDDKFRTSVDILRYLLIRK